jgi:hydrogenase expression/formation protein HypE
VRVVTGDTEVVERGKGDGIYITTAGVGLIPPGVTLRCLRDLTRGGLATALVEIATDAGVEVRLDAAAVPVGEAVRGACEILGLDPRYVANEGRLVAFVPEAEAARALAILRRHPGGAAAAMIGRVVAASGRGRVLAETLGGTRALDLLSGEQLPRLR